MLVMLAAALFAVRQIISRYIADTDRTSTTVVYTALTGAGIMTVPLLFVWQWPETRVEIALLLGIAASGAVGEMFVIRALQMTHAVILAPLQYTMLLWGIVYGYVIFSDLPDRWTLVGALIIIATGLYTLHRERVVARQRRAS
jgi:S-adenosylmethionine uptake transporter